MPRVTQKLRETWALQAADMREVRTHTQDGTPRSSSDIAILDHDLAFQEYLLTLPIGTVFDARELLKSFTSGA